jgi:hypothetical protein
LDLIAWIGGVIGAAFSRLVANEFKAWTPRLVAAVVQCAIRRLREDQRERYAEEWRSHINETPGEIGKLIVGFGLLLAAWKLSRISPKPRTYRIEEYVSALRAAILWRRRINKIPSITGKVIFSLVTLPVQKQFHIVNETVDKQTLLGMCDLILCIAAKEPDDPIIQELAAKLDKAEAEGFEAGYRKAAAERNVEPSERSLAAAIANERTRRRREALDWKARWGNGRSSSTS